MKTFNQFLVEMDANRWARAQAWKKSYLAAWKSIDGPAPKERTYKQVVAAKAARDEDRKMDATVDKIYNALMAGPKGVVVSEPPFKGSLSNIRGIGKMAVTQGHLADITDRPPTVQAGSSERETTEQPVHVTSFKGDRPGVFRFQIHSTKKDGSKGPIIHEVTRDVIYDEIVNHFPLSHDIKISEEEAERVTTDHWNADVSVGENRELRAIADHHYPY